MASLLFLLFFFPATQLSCCAVQSGVRSRSAVQYECMIQYGFFSTCTVLRPGAGESRVLWSFGIFGFFFFVWLGFIFLLQTKGAILRVYLHSFIGQYVDIYGHQGRIHCNVSLQQNSFFSKFFLLHLLLLLLFIQPVGRDRPSSSIGTILSTPHASMSPLGSGPNSRVHSSAGTFSAPPAAHTSASLRANLA